MGWCVLLLLCIYIHYCYCQISEVEKAYLALRHMSSRIFITWEYFDATLYCKYITRIRPTCDVMEFAIFFVK